MKKIVSLLISLVTVAGIASAQISVRKSDVGKPVEMATLSMSWSWIYRIDDTYFLVMKSDNQFDDAYWLKMGVSKKECLESVSDLQEMMDNMGDSDRYDVDNGAGKTFTVTLTRELGIKKMVFRGERHAGAGFLIPSNLTKATKWIEKNLK